MNLNIVVCGVCVCLNERRVHDDDEAFSLRLL